MAHLDAEHDRTVLARAYLAYLPAKYNVEDSWPLVLFLHGSGERGEDPEQLQGIASQLASQARLHFPCVVLVPQCRSKGIWRAEEVGRLLTTAERRYRIDPSRIYLIGYSMGGHGVWTVAAATPDRFAAVVPIAGGSSPNVEGLIDVPIWAFHGAEDPVVDIEQTKRPIAALREGGGSPKFTMLEKSGHGILDTVVSTPELWHWLSEQSLDHR